MLSVKVQGLTEAQAALRKAGASSEQLREPFLGAAKLVSGEASRIAPRRSGGLSRGHTAEATQRYGLVVVDKVYAGVIFGGWATRGLGRRAQPVAVAKGRSAIKATRAAFRQRAMAAGFAEGTSNKAFRQSRSRTRSGAVGAVRGGPIRPNPWVYQAGDRRADDLVKRFEQHMDGIAAVFNGPG